MNTKDMLEEIKNLYPEERIIKSKQRYEKVWNLESPAEPPLLAQSWLSVFWPPERVADKLHYEPKRRMRFQLEGIVKGGKINDDFIPSLFPDDRVGVIASAFGCEVLDRDDEHSWTNPVISKPEQVYSLKKPDIGDSGLSKQVLETIRYFRKETQNSLPIHPCDMQGPMATASMILGYQTFLEALHTHPKEVHHLLNLVTDAIIRFYHLQIRASGDDFIPIHAVPSAWMPGNKGVTLSDDLIAVISPQHYCEFAKHYNERIASEFGGLTLHSCGDVSGVLETILSTKGLTGLHLGQMSIKKISPIVKGRVLVIPACETELEEWKLVGEDHIREAIEICRKGTFAILIVGAEGDVEKEAQLINSVRGK